MLDLKTLSDKVDKALEKETVESLYSYIVEKKDKRIAELEKVAMELYELVHDSSNLAQNKIRADELYPLFKHG